MKKSETRLKMINSALELFHRQGVNATSIDQVLELSGTGKGQFTHYFKTKEGLVRAVIHFVHEVIRNGEAPTGYGVKSWKDLESWFQNYINFQEMTDYALSCPIGTIGNDIAEDQEHLRQDVRLFLEWARSKLAMFFAEKKAAGELVPAANPSGLADFCISIMQGGMLLTKIKRNPDMFQSASREALAYIRSLRVTKTTKRKK